MAKYAKSPFKSYALSPERLPKAKRRYNIKQHLLPDGKKKGFETQKSAKAEDAFRVEELKKSKSQAHRTLGAWLAGALAKGETPLSCASAVYMRRIRLRMISDLWRLLSEEGYRKDDIHDFTLIHPKWQAQSGRLNERGAKDLKKLLRNYLEKAGVTKANGMLFAGLHDEFDGKGYQLHFHGVVAGDKVAALQNLRGNFGFRTVKNRIYRPIEIKSLKKTARQLSYRLQSFWPLKKKVRDKDGKFRRERGKSRVLSPQHEEILLWLAQQNLTDLILFNGIRLGKDGLTSNAKKVRVFVKK